MNLYELYLATAGSQTIKHSVKYTKNETDIYKEKIL